MLLSNSRNPSWTVFLAEVSATDPPLTLFHDVCERLLRLAAKYIPAMQVAKGEEKRRLSASIEKSKEACISVFQGTQWGKPDGFLTGEISTRTLGVWRERRWMPNADARHSLIGYSNK